MWPKRTVLNLFFVILLINVAFGQQNDDAVKRQLLQITRDARNAALRNDMAVWDNYLADDYTETDENGSVKTKRQVIKDFRPVPAFADPRIDIENVDVRVYGETAILFFRGDLRMNIGGKQLVESFQITDVYIRRGGRWLLTAEHQSRVPLPPASVNIDKKLLTAYAGGYRIAPFVIVNFSVEHGVLIRQLLGDKHRDELVPENETTFFVKGEMRQIIFELDASGKVVASIYRLPDGQKIRALRID